MHYQPKQTLMQPNQSFDKDFYDSTDLFAAAAAADERAGFIMKTYLYLFGAIAALIGIDVLLFAAVGGPEKMIQIIGPVFAAVPMPGLILMGAFIFVSWIANSWALNATSPAIQHAGLALYAVFMSLILVPTLCLAQASGGSGTIVSAIAATAGLFALLTLTVFITRKDFSFMRPFLLFGGLAAMGFIAAALVFGFSLGLVFTYAMIAFFCCYILYDTSNILHHYRIGQHVAAALALFASVVMLFWYVLRLFILREE